MQSASAGYLGRQVQRRLIAMAVAYLATTVPTAPHFTDSPCSYKTQAGTARRPRQQSTQILLFQTENSSSSLPRWSAFPKDPLLKLSRVTQIPNPNHQLSKPTPTTNHPSTMSSTSIPPESDSQLQPHNGAGKKESVSPLQSHLNYLQIPTTPLPTVVQALHWLLLNPDFHLTPSITPTGKRLITLTITASADTTPSLTGTADLNTLGRIHLTSATRCRDEHASFKTRLLHVSLDEPIEKLYDASEKILSDGLSNGTVRYPPLSEDEMDECPCCRGDPDAVILFGFHHGNALYFEEDEYKAIWGDEEYHGLLSGSDGTWLMARKEMVERMVEAEEGENKGVSKL